MAVGRRAGILAWRGGGGIMFGERWRKRGLSMVRERCDVMLKEKGWRRLSTRSCGGGRVVGWRSFATAHDGKGKMVREFVFDSLYAPGKGYFQRDQDVVGSVTDLKSLPGGSAAGMDFNAMLSETEYRRNVQSLYDQGGSAWLTPSELFHPFYAHSVARHFLEGLQARGSRARAGGKFHVIEIGGGNGTFALGFLDYVKSHDPSVYDGMRYSMIEVSHKLYFIQKRRVCSVHPCAQVHHADATNFLAGSGRRGEVVDVLNKAGKEETLLIAMEVLDNLAHDKIVVSKSGDIFEVTVVSKEKEKDARNRFVEEWRPLQDEKIISYLEDSGMWSELDIYSCPESKRLRCRKPSQGQDNLMSRCMSWLKLSEQHREIFLPTSAHSLIKLIARSLPHLNIVLADFDFLPDAIPGTNAPVVQSKMEGRSRFHSSYLISPGLVDIFHPTDFQRLSRIYKKLTGREGFVLKHKEFCARYGDMEKTACINGYNPLLEDYSNMSMLVSHWPAAVKST